jgi:hypothetical protein
MFGLTRVDLNLSKLEINQLPTSPTTSSSVKEFDNYLSQIHVALLLNFDLYRGK